MRGHSLRTHFFGDRYRYWKTATEQNVKIRICSGHKGNGPLTPSTELLSLLLPQDIGSVLDFGCGIGRNIPMLAQRFTHVTGFDFPNMIDIARTDETISRLPNLTLTTDWSSIRNNHYDLIFATLVLQHLHPTDLREKSAELAMIAPALLLCTRWYTDFQKKSVLKIIEPHWKVEEADMPRTLPERGEHHWSARLTRRAV